jgi:hypothetical protein
VRTASISHNLDPLRRSSHSGCLTSIIRHDPTLNAMPRATQDADIGRLLQDRDVPPTNNISEREIRPSVVFRKVTNGFRSDWGAQIHAGYRSVTGTARIAGQTALAAIQNLVDGKFAVV